MTFVGIHARVFAMKNCTKKEVVWGKGRKKSDLNEYTYWSSKKDYARLGGFTIEARELYMKVNDPNVVVDISLTAHTSHGESHSRFFQIPVDKVDDLCHALQQIKQSVLSLEQS